MTARPVQSEPAVARPGIVAVTPQQRMKPDTRMGVEPRAPAATPARPEISRPPVVEQPRSEVMRPPVAAAPTRVQRTEPAAGTRVVSEPRVGREAQPREVQQPRMQEPRTVQPREVQAPHEVQPREVPSHERVSTPKQDRSKDTRRRPSDQPAK